MAGPDVYVRITSDDIRTVARALRDESDGRELRKDLAKNMRGAIEPAALHARAAILGMPSSGTSQQRPGLRQAIAKRIRPEVKLGGRWTGARVKAKKIPRVRGFANAPKRTQQAQGWRTRTYGTDNWRVQHGKTNWFDDSFVGRANEYRRAVLEAMDDMAQRIARRLPR